MLPTQAVDQKILELTRKLQSLPHLQGFSLVGGTALALTLGHRKSIDIDLFSSLPFDERALLETLEQELNFSLHFAAKNTLKGSIDGIKTDLLTHPYPQVEPPVMIRDVRVQSLPDITAMKLNAICISGQRVKDFIDLYFLTDHFTTEEMLGFYRKKYSQHHDSIALKSLVWFEDADISDWPRIIAEPRLTWTKVKRRLIQAVREHNSLKR